MPFRPNFTITDALLANVTLIERARGFLEAAALSETWVTEMRERATVLEAHHSTRIEGTHLTLEESTKLLGGEEVPGVDPVDALELKNYARALEYVVTEGAEAKRVDDVVICEIQRQLVEGGRGGQIALGRYRDVQNYVMDRSTGRVVYTPPPAAEVPRLMREFVDWLNARTSTSPIVAAGIAHFQLAHIHPFADGNGRTARLLSTLILHREGYDFRRLFALSEYYDRGRRAYYDAIQNVRESGLDLTGWLEYFTHGLTVQLGEVREQGERIIRRDAIAQEMGLGDRQRVALGLALDRGRFSLADFQIHVPAASRRTLQREIERLIDLGLLVRTGATTDVVYLPAEGLIPPERAREGRRSSPREILRAKFREVFDVERRHSGEGRRDVVTELEVAVQSWMEEKGEDVVSRLAFLPTRYLLAVACKSSERVAERASRLAGLARDIGTGDDRPLL